MSFPRYPKYKPSGVEWLGDVPEHWSRSAIKRVFHIVGGGTPASDSPEYWDGDVPWATPADLGKQAGFDLAATLRTITALGRDSCNTAMVPIGSIVLSTRAPIGSIGIAAVPLCTNQGCKSLVPRHGAHPRYFAYVLCASTAALQLRGKGTTFAELSAEALGTFPLALPPLPEQRAIAAFLDRETAKIDGLIAEQQRLIELLKEKRQAVISHAVTKGIDPKAPMKPSGVEWLGDVPAHWEASPLRSLARPGANSFTDGDWIEAPFITDEGVRLLQTGNIGVGTFKEQGFRFISEQSFNNLGCTEVDPGDVLICRLAEPVGRACLAPSLNVRMITSVDVCILKTSAHVCPRFLVHLMSSAHYLGFMEGQCRGGTRDRVSRSFLAGVRLLLPPLPEQRAIAAFLDRETAKIDGLVAEAESAITLLQERRSALISAAVTGQIDVRNAVATEAA